MSEARTVTTSAGTVRPRHYPPGVVFHAPHCIGGGNAMAVPTRGAFNAYPNRLFDACISALIPPSVYLAHDGDALAVHVPYVSVEAVSYHRHSYLPLDSRDPRVVQPSDAIRPLCRVCRGTHDGEV